LSCDSASSGKRVGQGVRPPSAALVCFALLAGCGGMPRSDAEVEDIAADVAADAISEKFSALEGRIEGIEQEKDLLADKVSSVEAEVAAAKAEAAQANREVAALRADYDAHTH
ncbi:MAG TPA: hypothetical protein VM265_12075, partial [Sphingomicrobium sp.]|nr:hypothetical protein [Sphingomicrobium sp.]